MAEETRSQRKNVDIEQNPALKLLDFFQGLKNGGASARMDTKETEKACVTMRGLRSVDGEWMRLWLDQWRF